MYPYLPFEVFGIKIGTFGISALLGFLSAWWLLYLELKRKHLNPDISWALFVGAIGGGIAGARIYYIIEHWGDFLADPGGYILSRGGLVWFGGLAGGIIVGIIIILAMKQPLMAVFDAASPSFCIGYMFGRLGCQLSGDGDYGGPTSLPWGMSYPKGIVPTMEKVHPTPIYEILLTGIILLMLWLLRKKVRPDGWIFSIYLMCAGLERFFIAFLRTEPRYFLHLTNTQYISLVMILGGLVSFIFLEKNKDRILTPANKGKN
jgi:phosphatidylglycerol:prolipoprotein diacylglycerol transferase